jgi:hypothetical protein
MKHHEPTEYSDDKFEDESINYFKENLKLKNSNFTDINFYKIETSARIKTNYSIL